MTDRLLLTGGTGFFGKALLRARLLHSSPAGIDALPVLILSRDPDQFRAAHPELACQPGIAFHEGDIQNRDSLPWGESFSHILHAATDSTLGPRLAPLQRFNQIVQGTTNILDLAVANGAKRFLLTSSGGIYGAPPGDIEAIPENWAGSPPLNEPATAYSQAKRAAEHLCSLYRDHHGIETVIARCFAFVGPDLPLDAHFAIGNFIRDALIADAICVFGDGTPLRTYLDQRDLALWLWTLLLNGINGEAYNVGSDQAISIGNLAVMIRDLIAPSKPVHIIGKADASGFRSRYVPCIKKIQELHQLHINFSLRQAIIHTASSFDQSKLRPITLSS